MADLSQESLPDGSIIYESVARMLQINDWHLSDAHTLAMQVGARLHSLANQAAPVEKAVGAALVGGSINGAALYCYAELLYRAFVGQEGDERQCAAYTELLRYIYRVTHRYGPELTPDEREEVTYIVVAELYYRAVPGHSVRVPGAFIAIALQQTRNTLRSWRSVARRMLSYRQENADDSIEDALAEHEPEDGLYLGAVRREQADQIRAAFAHALACYPRARVQFLVVWLHTVEGLDYQTIAANLNVSVANVRVLYSRGRSRLRDNVDLQALAAEEQLIDTSEPHIERVRLRGSQERS